MAKKFIRGKKMNYYIYMLVTLAVMLVVFKFIFCEIEAYNAKKRSILSWYFKLNESFKYVRTKSIILMGVFCYMIVSKMCIRDSFNAVTYNWNYISIFIISKCIE